MPPAASLTRRTFLAALSAAPETGWRWADTSRGRAFSKDPSVIRFGGRYLLYYSIPPFGDKRQGDGWAIGVAASSDLRSWKKAAEVLPAAEYEAKGLCAPCAVVIDGRVHLFYQTYGNGPKDAICHAVSTDGIEFKRNGTNPVFSPAGRPWSSGRAIDAEVFFFAGRWRMLAATRDPEMKVQMIVGAIGAAEPRFDREVWSMPGVLGEGPVLKPELAWERQCIEAPSVVARDGRLVMFYAGGYNNEPQQIGAATSADGLSWRRLSPEPILPAGAPGTWNSSESGHPGAFVDQDGTTTLFFQGNDDKGKTWHLSSRQVRWDGLRPAVVPESARAGG